MNITVTLQSELFGNEYFYYDTLDDALEGIKRLYINVDARDDGIERIIGIVVNAPNMS